MPVTINASTSTGLVQSADTSGNIELQNNGTTRLTVGSSGVTIPTLNTPTGVLATQNGMTGIAKAWVQVLGGNPPTVNGSFNVSSVTRVSTGIYTVAFTTAMSNANYAVATATSSTNANSCYSPQIFSGTSNWSYQAPTTGGFNYVTSLSTTNVTDTPYSCVVVYGT
jgi:hypothetical protein